MPNGHCPLCSIFFFLSFQDLDLGMKGSKFELYNTSTSSSLECQFDINYSETQIVTYSVGPTVWYFNSLLRVKNESEEISPLFWNLVVLLLFITDKLSASSDPESDGLLITTHRSFFSSKLDGPCYILALLCSRKSVVLFSSRIILFITLHFNLRGTSYILATWAAS